MFVLLEDGQLASNLEGSRFVLGVKREDYADEAGEVLVPSKGLELCLVPRDCPRALHWVWVSIDGSGQEAEAAVGYDKKKNANRI